ncbi:hypothetical protein ACFV6B_15330 [Streptomyces microflavus]
MSGRATEVDDLDPDEREAAIDAVRDKLYAQYELWGSDADESGPEV